MQLPNIEVECKRCGVSKPLSEYNITATKRFRKPSVCRNCWTNYRVRWEGEHPDKRVKYHQKWYGGDGALVRLSYKLQNKYGLTIDDYVAMAEAQDGLCAICACPEPNGRLCVDHDHETGAVRGLLCHQCNKGVGHFLDSAERCQAAADYLRRHNEGG